MEPFFERYRAAPVCLSPDEICPQDSAPPPPGGSVYLPYIRTSKRTRFDTSLHEIRQRALAGALDRKDFLAMDELLEAAKRDAQLGGILLPPGKETQRFYAYARVKTLAMLLSQTLFVDNVIKEGLLTVIESSAARTTVDRISGSIVRSSSAGGNAVSEEDARFYGVLFTLQTAFDNLFVPDENIVTYDVASGEYRVTELYERCTAYLELSNKKVLTASSMERKLCYDITTGWSEGIDRETWDKLNEYYYRGISPTTGEENLFVKNYDVVLEKMLPQFVLSKVKLSEELIRRGGEKVKVLEIGAGSGALAIDLAMSCKRLGVALDQVEYHGIEPSDYMRESFRSNVQRKIGDTRLPETWKLVPGSLEAVHEAPDRYLDPQGSTVLVFSFSPHHCFRDSIETFFRDPRIRAGAREAFFLEGVWEHGWTKPYYMWVDCESPENFDNVLAKGDWDSQTLWTEPNRPIAGHCVTLAWCCLRRLR